MRRLVLLALIAGGMVQPLISYGAASDIRIEEVFFNPAGTDTGLEYITIKNYGGVTNVISGWDLYPDGVGYFTFPDFSVPAGGSVTVHIRASGADDAQNLYHSAASKNMGNTSGSIAIFSGTSHSADTLVDFVEYGRAGETWESAAVSAGIWQDGEFVAVDQSVEGVAIKRTSESQSASSWAPSGEPAQNGGGTQKNAPSEPDSGDNQRQPAGTIPVDIPDKIIKTITASAGGDILGIAGAATLFEGRAWGFNGGALGGNFIRFFWNFGDGTTGDGKKVRHTYTYPGKYVATLHVTSGEESASDSAQVTIKNNPVIVSEYKTGAGGWIELSNQSSSKIDISGWSLNGKFTFREGTYIGARAFAVFSSEVTGIVLAQINSGVKLLYPNGTEANSLAYNANAAGKSVSNIEGTARITEPTPGSANIKNTAIKRTTKKKTHAKGTKNNKLRNDSAKTVSTPEIRTDNVNATSTRQVAAVAASNAGKTFSNLSMLIMSVAAGLFAGGVALAVKKRFLAADIQEE